MDNRMIIQRSLDYIEDNLQAEITAAELADMAHISLFHYYRLFQQATGLPVVTSTGVTRELPLEDLATYLPLTDTAAQWARVIQRVLATPRRDTAAEMAESGYDVRTAAQVLQQRYEEMV